jgi:hypothetical protein
LVIVFGIIGIVIGIIINLLLAYVLKRFWEEGKNGVTGMGQMNPGTQMQQIPQTSQMTINDQSSA